MKNSPIFIVGLPRSGTTLIAAMLGNHSRIACGPETQFFHKISESKLHSAISDPKWPRKAVEIIMSITLANQKVYELYNLSHEDIKDFLSKHKPSIRVMLEALTETYAVKLGRPRWSEKTNNHLLYLELIRKEFPESPVIRIIRDPRDSAISMRKLPWASNSVLANCYILNQLYLKSKSFFESDNNAITLRYEDLVLNPERELKKICKFIGEEFIPSMLDTRESGKLVSSPNEPWKEEVHKELYTSRRFAWKRELPLQIQEAATFLCFTNIKDFNYDIRRKPFRTVQVYPLNEKIIENNENIFINATTHGTQLIRSNFPLFSGNLLIIPDTVSMNYKSIAKMIAILFIRYIKKRPALYLSYYLELAKRRKHGKILTKIVKFFGKSFLFS